ncbi:hypothetical protein U1769_09225 [Sphingomonas sp. ZT3P38]|uniref:hypothetical protein n=1 Tax=Parasphingomonas zepuensis TaxID=3096161 RepID=UPI002FC8A431
MSDDKPMRQQSPATAAFASGLLAIDRHAYERLLSRRDELEDRLWFGGIAINAASLLALLSALGGKGEAAKWLGFDGPIALGSACAFTVGLIAAITALTVRQRIYYRETSDAYMRVMTAVRIVSEFETADPDDHDRLEALFQEYLGLPLVSFQFSRVAIVLQSLSGGAWLAGILMPITRALFTASGFG